MSVPSRAGLPALCASLATALGCFGQPTPSADDAPAAPPTEQLPGAGAAEPPEHLRCAFTKEDLEYCFVQIPGGTFLMGAQAADPTQPGHDPEALPDEGPPHRTEVSSFWIMRDEAIVSIFNQCLEAGACQEADVSTGGFSTWKGPSSARSRLPLTSISWDGAQRLCAFLGGRLPTEAEWEYAARGTDGRRFPWGDEPGCGVRKITGFGPDGRRKATDEMMVAPCELEGPSQAKDLLGESPFRLRGMGGNVWEWVADAYAEDAYANAPAKDPRGPSSADHRVQRGGGWTAREPAELRAAGRMSMPPDSKVHDVGVRCAWGTR